MLHAPAFAALIFLGASLSFARAEALPQWYRNLTELKNLEADFTQQSESKIFGTLKKQGRIHLSRPGKLRVAYEKGLILLSDGDRLVQYDPQTRTASTMDLAHAIADVPLLRLLVDPKLLEESYRVRSEPPHVRLEARQKGLPSIQLTGDGAHLQQVSWLDPSGARQIMIFKAFQNPGSLPASLFSLKLPAHTRWLNR